MLRRPVESASGVSIEERVTAGAEVGIEIPAALRLNLKAAVESGYQTTLEQAHDTSHKITVEMQPWTIVISELEIEKKEFASEIVFEKAGIVYQVPYRFTSQAPDLSKVSHKSVICPEKPSSLEITPSHVSLEVGKTTQLRAILLDSQNNAIKSITFAWQSDNYNVATVTKDGMVEAVGQGEVRITAIADEVLGRAGIKVTQTVARVGIEPVNPKIAFGKTVRLIATAVDSRGSVLSRVLRWSSQNEEIATVSPDGLVQGAWIGQTTVTATTRDGVAGISEVTILAPTIAFPEKTIVVIVPYRPGGTSDGMARIISKALRLQFNEDVVVRNIPGSDGAKGWAVAAQAKPDGYTMAIYTEKLRERDMVGVGFGDFEPVAMFTKIHGLLVPKGTNKERIMLLENAVRRAVASAEFQNQVYGMGGIPYYLESLKFSKIAN